MTITEQFEKIADKFQDRIALVFENEKFTYKEINTYSNRLARYLISIGVKEKDRIGLFLNESAEMVTGLFGILKCGASYVPMPDSFPIERVNDIVTDAQIHVLLTRSDVHFSREFIHPEVKIVCLDTLDLSRFDKQNLKTDQQDHDCVYSIYTSGSTGKPKGVSISHANLINLTDDLIKRCQLSEKDRAIKYAGFGFDASILEIFPTLLAGGALHILDKETKLNISKLKEYFDLNQITYCFLPTQFAEIFIHTFPNQTALKNMIVGGDKLKKVQKTNYKILNMYGPTETTVAATVFEVDRIDYKNIPIGKPLDNYKIYIVDHHMNLCPVGVVGELCIAGSGVGLGYINLPQVTNEKFILNPFATSEELKEGKNKILYRSGDLAKWLSCGNIEFLGRVDFQVKIRGFRIELEEVEHKLSLLPEIEDCLVLALKDKNDEDTLCGYYTSETEINSELLTAELSKNLPDYMVPSAFCWMKAFPINANGKIDRKNLPKPILRQEEFVPPHNEKEELISRLMCEILDSKQISIRSNFFHIGGNSLKSVLLVSKLQNHFDVKVSDIFQYKTIEHIAAHVTEKQNQIVIKKQNRDKYPLTAPQKGIYFASILDPKSTIYNLPMAIEIVGILNRDTLGQAIDLVVSKHRILKTKFVLENNDICQVFCPDLFIAKDFQKTRIQELPSLFNEFVKPFDFFKGPLFRIKLMQIELDRHILFMDIHHVISDGFSQNLFIHDLFYFYGFLKMDPAIKSRDDSIKSRDDSIESASDHIDFFDYSVFEGNSQENTLKQNSSEYWSQQDLHFDKVHIPMDFPEDQFSDIGHSLELQIDESFFNKISTLSQELGVTKYVLFLSAFLILISKYARSDKVTVGGFFSGRSLECLQDMFGMFVSTLPISVHLSSQMESHLFLTELQGKISELLENQNISMTDLMESSGLSNINGRNPFFNNAFNFVELDNYCDDLLKTNYLNIAEHKRAHFDLTLSCFQMGNKIKVIFEYSKESYKMETMKTAMESFLEILKSIVEKNTSICDIPFATEKEKALILEKFNKTDHPVDEKKSIAQWFEEIAFRFKDNNALVFKGKRITYGDLNKTANQIANHLRKNGVSPNDRVGIFVSESFEMITGILGILKSGACYVPMSDSFPLDRVNLILEDAEIKILLTQKDLCPNPDHFPKDLNLIFLDDLDLRAYDFENPILDQNLDDPVYSIYTSGSTGRPKGVSISQRNLIYLAADTIRRCELSNQSQCLKYMGYAFDASVIEIFPSLLAGGCLHILDKETKLNVVDLKKYFEEKRITFCVLPTQFAEIFMQELEDNMTLKCMIIGGDKLRKVKPHHYKVFNMYGPTETTVAATSFELDGVDYKNIPIGKPIDNYRAYIVDSHMNLCPIGVTGELCIAGCGVGLGYINLPKVTNERFIKNPFANSLDIEKNKFTKMYRTGDLARWKEDGNIEFIGRIDFQVKINGFRIELGEIESKLLVITSVTDAVVLALKDKMGSDYLCGYYTSPKPLDDEFLQLQLSKSLPEYMIPSVFSWMETFPINTNGKVDRKKLPLPAPKEQIFCKPQNWKETLIAKAMQEVLGVEEVSVNTSFFHMNGNSLKAVLLVSKLQSHFQITVSDIFNFKTVKNLAENIYEHKHGFSLEKRFSYIREKLTKEKSQNHQEEIENLTCEYRKKNEKYKNYQSEKTSRLFPLVTGGTGYLGCHIVLELLSQTDCNFAVLVRGSDLPSSKDRLYHALEHYWGAPLEASFKERIYVLQGDISEPQFYLGARDYFFLTQNVTCVINAAANVKHFGEIEQFYHDNVTSVLQLISFCKETNCVLHHISTYSVSAVEKKEVDPLVKSGDDKIDPIFTEYHMRDSNLLENPYLKTKMQAEEEILKAQKKDDLKANIYRVGNLVFNTRTNLHQINIDNNGFYQSLKCILNIGYACNHPSLDYAELSPVNETAKAIVLLLQQENLKNEIFHIYNENYYRISDIFSSKLKFLDLDSFLEKIKFYYDHPFVHDNINNYMLHSGWLNLNNQIEQVPISNEKTNLILNQLNFHWSQIRESNFIDMIDQSLKNRYELLQENKLLTPLGFEFIKDLSLYGRLSIVKENEIVMSKFVVSKSLYFILDGFAQISVLSDPGGWISSIGVLSQNDLIGVENTVSFENKNMIVDSILGDLVLLELEEKEFKYLKEKHGQFFDMLLIYSLKSLHNNNLLISNFA